MEETVRSDQIQVIDVHLLFVDNSPDMPSSAWAQQFVYSMNDS